MSHVYYRKKKIFVSIVRGGERIGVEVSQSGTKGQECVREVEEKVW